jgi:hypothetical protein
MRRRSLERSETLNLVLIPRRAGSFVDRVLRTDGGGGDIHGEFPIVIILFLVRFCLFSIGLALFAAHPIQQTVTIPRVSTVVLEDQWVPSVGQK